MNYPLLRLKYQKRKYLVIKGQRCTHVPNFHAPGKCKYGPMPASIIEMYVIPTNNQPTFELSVEAKAKPKIWKQVA